MPSSVRTSPRELGAVAEAPSGPEPRPLLAGGAASAHASAPRVPPSWPERDPHARHAPTTQCGARSGTTRAGVTLHFWPQWPEMGPVLFAGYLKIPSH